MKAPDDDNREPEPVDSDREQDTGIAGGGGPASVIYGDKGDDEADEYCRGDAGGVPDEESVKLDFRRISGSSQTPH